jgi:vancomycin permeability regulator SanA
MRHERWPSLSAEDTVRPVVATPLDTGSIAPVRAGVALRGIAGLSARVLAFWFGSLCVVNVLAGLRHSTFDPNIWWIDLRFLPKPGGQLLLLTVGVLLVWHGLRPATGGWRRTLSLVAIAIAAIVASMNAVTYYRIWDAGTIAPRSPVPLSLVIAVLLALIAVSMLRPSAPVARRTSLEVIVAVSLAFMAGLPLLQMAFFGTTDYRRPADAVVVFGARVRSDGAASLTLANRVRTASELYREGLTDTIVMTGGIEPTGIDETIVMRDLAVQPGVPSEAIILDAGGDNTNASVANTVRVFRDNGLHRILAVSQFYHLPRIKLAYARAGLDVWTVPARTSLVPRTWAIVAREIPAFWLYYFRAVVA